MPRYGVEYSQPNTHKSFTSTHEKPLLGFNSDNLHKCQSPNLWCDLPGDVGTHVAKCLWYSRYSPELPKEGEDKGAKAHFTRKLT